MSNKAALFIMFGQSNAQGYSALMKEEDKITAPLKNVYGLGRDLNQNFENDKLNWEGYTTYGTNLGQAIDHSYSVSACLAKKWQDEIDAGVNLPDLYIINIAVGAQGITEKYMWWHKKEAKISVNEDGAVDIALYPFALHILSMVKESFASMGKEIAKVEFHWRGGENDAEVKKEELETYLKGLYEKIFDGFNNAYGEKLPTTIHQIFNYDRAMDCDPTGEFRRSLYYINDVFDSLVAENENIDMFDVRNYPGYIPDVRGNGMYMEDAVHYTGETNTWVAGEILKDYKKDLL